jgi:hypothetical protein
MGWTPLQQLLIASVVVLLPSCATQVATGFSEALLWPVS